MTSKRIPHYSRQAGAAELSGPTVAGLLGSVLVAFLSILGFSACDDNPFLIRWEENPDTVLLYSLARPELNLLSGFDFVRRVSVRIEAPSSADSWDLALDTQDGALVFLPPGALGVNSTARVAVMEGRDFAEVRRAPADTAAYVSDAPVPVSVGTTYVIQTRQSIGGFGQACLYYGKFQPLAQDLQDGSVTFQFDVSPVCNDRKLFPPKD